MTWAVETGFFFAVLPLVLTPGASFTLVTQAAVAGRRVGVIATIAGTATGICCHALLAAVGLAAVVMRSSQAFSAIKVIGGAYLIALGTWTLWRSRRTGAERSQAPGPVAGATAPRLPWTGHQAYPQAVLANVLNPKAASVYLTLAPQFLHAGDVRIAPVLALAGAHITAMSLWLGGWSLLLRRGLHLATTTSLRQVLVRAVTRLGGAVLIALGVRTAAAA